jgi:hypothetical protein
LTRLEHSVEWLSLTEKMAGTPPFVTIFNFRVSAFSRIFERGEGVIFRMSTLGMERSEHQNPNPLNPKGSATRKSETSHSASTYWSDIIRPGELVIRKKRVRLGHLSVLIWER